MTSFRAVAVVLIGCLLPSVSLSQPSPRLEGVWEKLTTRHDGKELPLMGRQLKLITKSRWMWIYQDRDKAQTLLAQKTSGDSLAAYIDMFGAGAGTYKLSGSTYTETPEFFQDLQYIGRPLEFTVKVEGDRLYQTGKFPVLVGGTAVRHILLEEVFKRIE